MLLDDKSYPATKNKVIAKHYKDMISLRVLPRMDEQAERDFTVSMGGNFGDDEDLEILREGINCGFIKASGIYRHEDERVGTFFWSVLHGKTGDKTLLIVGVGAEKKPDGRPIYAQLMKMAVDLAKGEGCRWIKTGSTRSGAIRQMLEFGATPVRVDFCMEVK